MRISIVGGGIGGCALALSLHDAGLVAVTVHESVSEVRELGVGINLLPHAVRELTELGLLPSLVERAVATARLEYHDRHGHRIWSEPRGVAAGYRWPQLSIHRGTLLAVLHAAVRERLGADRYRTGEHLTTLRDDGDRVWASFTNRRTALTTEVETDVLVACDGIHSAVRAQLHPHEGPPLWNGITMWRGVSVAPPFLGGRTMIMAGVIARRVVVYPILDLADGRQLVNWVGEVRREAAGQPMPRQDWDVAGSLDEVLGHFRDFRFEWLDVPDLLGRCHEVLQYPMVDRDPLASWGTSRVTLLGDAAHPMYPVGSNGASQAILDARVLAHHLATAPGPREALAAYEQARRPATTDIVLANRRAGPERCMEIVAERAPDGFTDVHDVITRDELEEISRSYRQTAGFDPAALNERPSWRVRT